MDRTPAEERRALRAETDPVGLAHLPAALAPVADQKPALLAQLPLFVLAAHRARPQPVHRPVEGQQQAAHRQRRPAQLQHDDPLVAHLERDGGRARRLVHNVAVRVQQHRAAALPLHEDARAQRLDALANDREVLGREQLLRVSRRPRQTSSFRSSAPDDSST